ncbi:MAG: right-handed parallel beta-helix repeat-containing protein [Elusimicrobia bacterium]|nr:right-handed parallel beta-helix repeat-containing protein [Elusimicrobiota bacterium]
MNMIKKRTFSFLISILLLILNSTLFCTIYYVQTDGNDSNSGRNTGSSYAWRHINYAAGKAIAGDTVYIKAGNYGKENVYVAVNGTSASPIVFEGYKNTPGDNPQLNYKYGDSLDATVMPLIDGGDRANAGLGISLSSRKYITVKNIQITNYNMGVYGYGAQNVTVANIITTRLGDINAEYDGTGIKFGANANNCIISSCVVLNACAQGIILEGDDNLTENSKVYADDNTTGEKSATDYYINVAGNNNIVRNCYIERIGNLAHGGHGIEFESAGTDTTENNQAINCITRNLGAGFSVRHRGAKNNLFENCIAYDGDIGLRIRDGASYNTFKNCHTVKTYSGVAFLDTDEDGGAQYCGRYNSLTNCIFENTRGNVINFFYYSLESPADNNTFTNCVISGGNYLFNTDRTNYSNKMVNCIVTGVTNYLTHQQYPSIAYPLDFTFTYTDFWSNGFSAPAGTGNISTNPFFNNAANGDFHIKSQYGRWTGTSWVNDTVTSPCLDAGDPVSSYSNEPFYNGGRINIGAYGNTTEASKSLSDEITPSVVANLSTNSPGTNSIILNWSAPGDDGTVGTVSVYDLRYATYSITNSNWDNNATHQCTDEPVPQIYGTNQSYTVQGLSPNKTYFFSVKSADEKPNWSSVSNSPSGKTKVNTAPVLSWSGDTGYTTDGLEPETGSNKTNFTYKVKYSDIDNNAPKEGYPKVHIKKGSTEISGSPFIMVAANANSPSTGRNYSLTTKLSVLGNDYSYFFEAQDINDAVATGLAAATVDSPDINMLICNIEGDVKVYKNSSGISDVQMVISGLSATAPLADIKINSSFTTGISGNYELSDLTGSSNFSVTPVKTGWRFWPKNMEYSMLDNDLVGQNYVGRPFSVTMLINPMVQVSSGMSVTPMIDSSGIDSEISVTVPMGAFSLITTLTLTSTEVPVSNNNMIKVVGYGVAISNDKNLQPTKGIIITINYDDSSISGYNKDNLVIGRYNETNKYWEVLPTTKNGMNKLVAGSNHLSKFALLELVPTIDLSNIKIYPNPYNPAIAVHGKLKVTNLPINSIIKLYSVTGELVRELKELDFGNLGWLEWDGKNSDGDNVSRGVYIYQIEDSAGSKKTGKIGLIK